MPKVKNIPVIDRFGGPLASVETNGLNLEFNDVQDGKSLGGNDVAEN